MTDEQRSALLHAVAIMDARMITMEQLLPKNQEKYDRLKKHRDILFELRA